MNILIADDELRLRKIVAMFLKKSGHEVTEASSGEQALELLDKKIQPDVIVLDINMPGIGGIETSRRIKADAHLKNTPIILLTANISDESRKKGSDAGAAAYVTKPFSPKDLLEQINSVVAN